jgi:hypothetical protein
MSLRSKIKEAIDMHTELVGIDRANSYSSERPLSYIKIIINNIANATGHNLRVNEEEEQRYSCWCFLLIDGIGFEAKIVHKGRGKFKILSDEYGGKYRNKIVDASDVVHCKIGI